MEYKRNTNKSKYNDFYSLIYKHIIREKIYKSYNNNDENEISWYNNIKKMKLKIESKYINYKRKYNNDNDNNITKESNFREKSKPNKIKYTINNLVNKKVNKTKYYIDNLHTQVNHSFENIRKNLNKNKIRILNDEEKKIAKMKEKLDKENVIEGKYLNKEEMKKKEKKVNKEMNKLKIKKKGNYSLNKTQNNNNFKIDIEISTFRNDKYSNLTKYHQYFKKKRVLKTLYGNFFNLKDNLQLFRNNNDNLKNINNIQILFNNYNINHKKIQELKKLINTYNTKRYKFVFTKDKCNICLEDFQKNYNIFYLPCLHKFHQLCISNWVFKNSVCPICKYDMSSLI